MGKNNVSCPMCGAAVLCAYNHKAGEHDIFCTGCEVEERGFASSKEAWEYWNAYWESEWEQGSKVIFKL